MNNRLYELIDRKHLKEVRNRPEDRYLIADIQNKDVLIRFFTEIAIVFQSLLKRITNKIEKFIIF